MHFNTAEEHGKISLVEDKKCVCMRKGAVKERLKDRQRGKQREAG